MAEDKEVKPCCAKKKEIISSLKEKRDYLRNVLKNMGPKIDDLQKEKLKFMQDYEAERVRAGLEKEAREKEVAVRVGLEKEILDLKSEVETKRESRDDGEVDMLRSRILEFEGEICRLKELLEEERKKGELERKKAEEACKVEMERGLKERSVRAGLEKEILELKYELDLLKESKGRIDCGENGEAILLQNCVLEREVEISRLNVLLEEERQKGVLEKERLQTEKKKAEDEWKIEVEARSKESSLRASLEKETLDLKSEITSLLAERTSRNNDESGEIVLLQTRVSEGEAESIRLRALLDQERKRADSEKKKAKAEKKNAKSLKLENETKLKESTCLENEILKLKSEITLLQEKMASRDQDEVLLLQSRVSNGEAEIVRLNELLEKERNRVDSENKRAEVEKKKASEAWKLVKSEKSKAEDQKTLVDTQKTRAEEYRLSLEASRAEANELRAKLVSERSRNEAAHKKLEDEKQMTNREKKHAESVMAKAEAQKRCVEEEKKKLVDERNRSDYLSQELEVARMRNESLEKEIQKITSARKMIEALPVTLDVSRNAGGNLTLLQKHLKLEKMHTKHAKRAAKLEKMRNNLLEQELHRLKQDFFHFSHRLNALDGCFSKGFEGRDASTEINNFLKLQGSNGNDKSAGKEPFSLYGKRENELVKAGYTNMDCFDHFRSTVECSTLLSDGSGSSTKPISGISSTLESLIGGSVRNKLPNSAIYSTSTSFTDRPSVGSQENNLFSIPRPDNLIESLKQGTVVPRLSADDTKLRINENLGVVVEDESRTSIHMDMDNPCLSPNEHGSINGVCGDLCLERKCLPYELNSFVNFPTQKEKVGDGNNVLILEKIDKNLDALGDGRYRNADLLDGAQERNCMSSKKQKVTNKLNTEVTKAAGVINQTVLRANYFEETTRLCNNETADTVKFNKNTEVSLEEMTSEDIMELLELDDPDDEERFRLAMEMPLSPALPAIEIRSMEPFEVDDSIILEKNINSGMPNQMDCRFSLEVDSHLLKVKSSGTSHCSVLHQLKGPDCIIEEPQNDIVDRRITSPLQDSNISTPTEVVTQRNEVVEVPLMNSEGYKDGSISKFIVAFPNLQENNMSRIISACEACVFNCSTDSQNVWIMDKILVSLAKEENLLAEEKACVFFSLLLNNFLVAASVNFRNFCGEDIYSCSNSLLAHIKTVMPDAEMRNILLELFQLGNLLSLIESFLIDKRRVMVYNGVTNQPNSQCDSQSVTLLDGTVILLSSETATTDKLVAGSFILASMCAITGHIGFLCEASYKILQLPRSESYLTLTVLHVFSYICGSKYFTLSSHSSIMTVVRSIVTLLEKDNAAIDAASGSYIQDGNKTRLRFSPCSQCLFSKNMASVDEVLNWLLNKLQDRAVTMIGHQPNIDVTDIFSLVELMASYMSWEWTQSNIIPKLINILESCVSDKFSVSVILLIGQLGRIGIDDNGCEQLGVEELRCRLAVFLNQRTTRNWTLPVQFSIIHALMGLLSVNFGELVKSEVLPADTSQRVHANLVRAWFWQLPEEQKSLSFGILQPAHME